MRKKTCEFYIKDGISLETLKDFGFERTDEGHWVWRDEALWSGLYVDKNTRRLLPTSGAYCSRTVAVVIALAEAKLIYVDDNPITHNRCLYAMRLTYEEVCAVEAMRKNKDK